jgi:signal transduction histidine kinase
MGDARRGRHLHLESVRARADHLSRERHVLAEMAVSQERSRIARELHDVVAHHVSLMIVTAGAADRQLRRNPEIAHRIIEDLIGTGRSAVIEMRRMLGVLRSDDQRADRFADLRPQPTLAELDTLIATFADAGLAIKLTVSGQSRSLPAGVELTAYRILQESLTNALRHAGAGTDVQVGVGYRTDSLFLEVTDHGVQPPAGPPAEPGHGLIGMRERVTLLGGHLDAAPLPEGGFSVRATLPLSGDHLAQRHLV